MKQYLKNSIDRLGFIGFIAVVLLVIVFGIFVSSIFFSDSPRTVAQSQDPELVWEKGWAVRVYHFNDRGHDFYVATTPQGISICQGK